MDTIICINKPKDITSQDAVTNVKKILRVKKAGHTGTLDPIATGLLLVCTNRATRLASYFSDLDKEYKCVMKLGETTDSQDAYGKLINKRDRVEVSRNMLYEVLESFKGRILQRPPMFSALKHKGKPLYKLARKGIDIERNPREINIHEIELLDYDIPYITFRTVCSKGTYIRTLCDDIGKKLGTGAHLSELERTAIGPFNIKDSLTFDDLTSVCSKGRTEGNEHGPCVPGPGIYTMDKAMSWLPEFIVKESMHKAVIHGNPVRLNLIDIPDKLKTASGIRIKSTGGDLLAIGSYSDEKNMIKMDVVFA